MKKKKIITEIESLVNIIFNDVVSFRNMIHKYPELSFREKKTSKFICSVLDENKINYKKNIAGFGVVAIIKGQDPGVRVIGLRADMDALPIQEENDVSYKSVNDGVMHACGHDVHSSILLGTAIIVNKLKNNLKGTIKFIFQPAEEKLPGGASLMIDNGVLENPKVNKMIALHVFPEMEVGNIGFKSGQYMAACDDLKFVINGKGGHAALPEKTKNPITVASELILNTRKKVSEINTKTQYILEYGDFRSFGASNVIPEKSYIEGTLRTINEEFRNKAHEILLEEVKKIEAKYKVTCDFEIIKGYPSLINDPYVTKKCINLSNDILNKKNIHKLPIRMASEDFSFFSQSCPSSFFRLGVSNTSRGINSLVHTSTFDIDQESIRIGLNLMSYFAFEL